MRHHITARDRAILDVLSQYPSGIGQNELGRQVKKKYGYSNPQLNIVYNIFKLRKMGLLRLKPYKSGRGLGGNYVLPVDST